MKVPQDTEVPCEPGEAVQGRCRDKKASGKPARENDTGSSRKIQEGQAQETNMYVESLKLILDGAWTRHLPAQHLLGRPRTPWGGTDLPSGAAAYC